MTCGGWDRGESPSSGSEAATPHGAAVALAVMRLKWPLRLVSVLPLLFSVLPLLFSVLPLLESPIAPPPLPSIRPPLPPIRPPPPLPPALCPPSPSAGGTSFAFGVAATSASRSASVASASVASSFRSRVASVGVRSTPSWAQPPIAQISLSASVSERTAACSSSAGSARCRLLFEPTSSEAAWPPGRNAGCTASSSASRSTLGRWGGVGGRDGVEVG